jgi:hypothetical protein
MPGGSVGTTTSFDGVGVRGGWLSPLASGPPPPGTPTPTGSWPLPSVIVTSAMRARPATERAAAIGVPFGRSP